MAKGEDGFTLLETLIALVVITAALASLQQGLGAGWKGLRSVRAEVGAVTHARAQLAAAGVATPLLPGTTGGVTADGYRWQLEIAPAAASDGATARPPRYAGYWVTATVERQGGSGIAARSVSLRTMKIGAPPR